LSELKLIDPCNRHLNYLRISITDRCNLKCIYCVPRDHITRLSHADILTYEEILRIVKVGIQLGISKVRVTGGEPLVRKGVYKFLSELSRISGLADLSLTTNGVALKEGAGILGLIGIMATLFVIVAIASALIVSLKPPWTRIAVRVAGSWMAAIGMLMFGWLIRGQV